MEKVNKNNDDFDDDIPELEDLSDQLSKFKNMNLRKNDDNDEIKVNVINNNVSKNEIKNNQNIENKIEKKNENVKKTEENNELSGFKFKKGFFLRNNNNNQNQNKTNTPPNTNNTNKPIDLSHIKAKNTDPSSSSSTKKDEKLIFKEVQEEMKSSNPIGSLLNNKNEWLNQDLLTKIAQNPNLLKYFMDPRFTEAIQLMQSDPKKAMQIYGSNPEFSQFMKDFSSIMAEHFNKLGQKQNETNFDEETQKIMKNPKIEKFLQKLQIEGKIDPNEIQSDEELAKNVKILIDKGVLRLQNLSN